MSEPVLLEIVIAAPADTVWRALRDRDEIRRWFGWDYEGFDAEIEFIFFGDAGVDDAARTLDFGPMGRLALEDRSGGTAVTFVRAAPDGRTAGTASTTTSTRAGSASSSSCDSCSSGTLGRTEKPCTCRSTASRGSRATTRSV